MTTHAIGTSSRDYSTLQAWEDAIPATLTTFYIGECYNDSEFTDGFTFAGHSGLSSTNYVRLTAASGQSFQDHANVRTNALFYDQTKGVGISGNTLVDIQNDYLKIDRIQFKMTSNYYGNSGVRFDTYHSNVTFKDCIIGKEYSSTVNVARIADGDIINCLIYDNGATVGDTLVVDGSNCQVLNCTIVRVGTAAGSGIVRGYDSPAINNTAVFNFTTNFNVSGGSWGGSSGYNATNSASAPGSNNQVSKTFSSQFESTTNDFRLKSGADCINTGNTDATNAPNDISGTARGTTTSGDIGAWEYSAAGGTTENLLPLNGVFKLTGAVPALRTASKIAPLSGSLRLTGAVPTMKVATKLAPLSGVLRLSGGVPTVKLFVDLDPLNGSLRLGGNVPTVSTGLLAALAPEAGTLKLTGNVSTIKLVAKLSPLAGVLRLGGSVPTISTSAKLSPLTGVLRLAGNVPTITTTTGVTVDLAPLSGVLQLSGNVPTISTIYNAELSPLAGVLRLSGHVPTITLKSPGRWTKIDRASGSWTKVAAATGGWTKLDKASGTWTKIE